MKAFPRLSLACVLFFALASGAWAVPNQGHGERSFVRVPVARISTESTTSVIVGFDPAGEAKAMNSAQRLGARSSRRAKSGGLAVVQVPAGANVADFVAELKAQPGVQYAEPDTLVYTTVMPTDPYAHIQWGLATIGAPSAWDVTEGASVKVAIVDSGVDLNHPDLVGRIDTVYDYDFVNRDATAQDDDGHGTHVAGIIAATLNNDIGIAGVANKCTILPVKVMNSVGTGTSSNVADGIRWAADCGAQVINLSLGAPTSSSAIDAAVQYAVSKDCVVVAASGNDGVNSVYYPAAGANVIGVGSTDSLDSRSGFSNYGPKVDISAPGSFIFSTLPGGGYGYMSGTSMATPEVAGVVALIRAKNPTWNRTMVERQLLGTTLDLGVTGRDNYFGYGRVRADRAVGATVTAGALKGVASSGGAPLAGVLVTVPDCPPVLTASDGTYTVPDIIPTTYSVTYSKSGFAVQAAGVTVPDGGIASQDVSLRAKIGLSAPKVRGLASARSGTTLGGTVSPAHSTRLSVQVRRLVHKRWKTYRTLKVTSSASGVWRKKLKLRHGTYSIRVYSAGDQAHVPGFSAWRKVTVH
jgi:thermitase